MKQPTTTTTTAEQSLLELALIRALRKLGFKDISKTTYGIITSEDRPGITPKQLREEISKFNRVRVEGIKRNHGRIAYYDLLPLNWRDKDRADLSDEKKNALLDGITKLAQQDNEAAAEVLQHAANAEQKKRAKAVIHIGGSDAGEVIPYTKKDLGYFFWELLDDLYLSMGLDFILKVIGDGGNPPSKKEQKILANRFLHAFSFEQSN